VKADNLSIEGSKPSNYGWVVVGFVFLAQVVAFGLVYSFGVFFKPLAEGFGWSRTATVGAFSAYSMTHNFFAPITGKMADKYGPRVVAIMGGFCIGLAMFLMSTITAIWQLYLFYAAIFSLGIASIYAPLMAMVSQWFEKDKRGFAIGIATAGLGVGSLVFSPFSAWLITSYSWQMAYLVMGGISWVVFIPIVIFLRRAPNTGMEAGQRGGPSKDFTAAEALKTRAFWMLSLAWFFMGIALWAVMINMVPLLTDIGVPMVTAGTIAGTIGAGSIAGRVGMGFLSDKIGRKGGILIGFGAQLIAVILLLFCQEIWMFFLFAVIFGFGYGGAAGILPAFPVDYFGSKATATILGLMIILGGVGVALGTLASGRIFDVTGSYYYMIWMCIIALVMAIGFGSLVKAPTK